jgi:two-component system phosphate regulon response regulator PhoB
MPLNLRRQSSTMVLIIEDEIAIRELLRCALEDVSFHVLEAGNIREANLILQKQLPHLILLDWMLPGGSGVEYIKKLKSHARTQTIPIIMLTARAEEHHKISGLEQGADDYITKPFSPRELIARIKSVLRRGGSIIDGNLHIAQLRLNKETKEVFIQEEKILFTPAEYHLLYFFLTHPKKVYSREQLLDILWPHQEEVMPRTIDMQIRRLRKRLKSFGYDQWIQTVRGMGYRFNPAIP